MTPVPKSRAFQKSRPAGSAGLSALSPCRLARLLPAVVTHLDRFGAFCDIGCGNVSLLSIEHISISRINHSRDRFQEGQHIFVAIGAQDPVLRRINLTHKELLGTWQENAQEFSIGETVVGIVRSIKDYGVFIELSPNLSGLAEYRDDLHPGDRGQRLHQGHSPGASEGETHCDTNPAP